jgi:hypothetical protein
METEAVSENLDSAPSLTIETETASETLDFCFGRLTGLIGREYFIIESLLFLPEFRKSGNTSLSFIGQYLMNRRRPESGFEEKKSRSPE